MPPAAPRRRLALRRVLALKKAPRRQSAEETWAAKVLTAGQDGNASPLHSLLQLPGRRR
ncbi:MAG: hypothetical protein ACRDTC_11750 [Pseudonocardiaceae bacterium]